MLSAYVGSNPTSRINIIVETDNAYKQESLLLDIMNNEFKECAEDQKKILKKATELSLNKCFVCSDFSKEECQKIVNLSAYIDSSIDCGE